MTKEGLEAFLATHAELPKEFQADHQRLLEEAQDLRMPGAEKRVLTKSRALLNEAQIWSSEVRAAESVAALESNALAALRRREDLEMPVDGTTCCLFRSPYRDWRRTPQRRAAELAFLKSARVDPWQAARQYFLVVSQSPHVIDAFEGPQGLSRKNRLARAAADTQESLRQAIVDLGKSIRKGPRPELYIVSHHSAGRIALNSSPRLAEVEYEPLARFAAKHGVRLRLLGCQSGNTSSIGIREGFDALPLVRALARVMGRADRIKTRIEFYEALTHETGLRFVLDILAFAEGEKLARGELPIQRLQPHTEQPAVPAPTTVVASIGGPESFRLPRADALYVGYYGSLATKPRGHLPSQPASAVQIGDYYLDLDRGPFDVRKWGPILEPSDTAKRLLWLCGDLRQRRENSDLNAFCESAKDFPELLHKL
jgi:hypothetical protein